MATQKQKKQFTFDNLTSTEFEDFCFQLLKLMGFKNVRWRKGTGLSTSPSDQGRDIECERVINDIDNKTYVEKWFIECKHYKEGVPAEKISGALAWAEAERPDVLVLAVSNFLSNQTLEYLKNYRNNNKPSFRIKEWQLPDLEDYSKDKILLLSTFGLEAKYDFINIMHPAHLQYIKSTQLNSMEYLFECLDMLEQTKREEIASWLYLPIIRARRREAISGDETMRDLLLDPEDYETLKEKSFDLVETGLISDPWLTSFFVSYLLQATFAHGNTTEIDSMVKRMQDSLDFIDELEKNEPDNVKLKDIQKSRPLFEKHKKELPRRIYEGHKVYEYFCEEVVTKLLQEELYRNYIEYEKKTLA